MIKRIEYVNSAGETVAFDWDSLWHYSGTTLFDFSLSYDSDAGASRLRDEPAEKKLTAHMRGGGLEERNRAMAALLYDVEAGACGTLAVGGSRLECRLIAAEFSKWHFDDDVMAVELTLLADRAEWVREHYVTLSKGSSESLGGLDYPHDYPHDYMFEGMSQVVDNPFPFPARADIIIPGPASSPYVVIAGNRYQVNADVPAGFNLEIRGRDKAIALKDRFGGEINVFDRGVREPGAYVFEPVPPGKSDAVWSGPYSVGVRLYESRKVPFWI